MLQIRRLAVFISKYDRIFGMENDKGLAVLINKAKKGSQDAYGEIYRYFLKRIYRFIYYLIFDNDTAEDLTQDTFFKAWRSLGTYDVKKGSFQTFLFVIARNVVIDHQRKKKPLFLNLEKIAELPSAENLEQNLVIKGEAKGIHRLVNRLGGFDKQILVLRYFEEFSMAEIAKMTSKKEGAIRVRIHRALKKLKSKMEGN